MSTNKQGYLIGKTSSAKSHEIFSKWQNFLPTKSFVDEVFTIKVSSQKDLLLDKFTFWDVFGIIGIVVVHTFHK